MIGRKAFLRSHFQRVKRVKSELRNYLVDPNEQHVHDMRTSIRRLEASFNLLPKSVRKKKNRSGKFYSQLGKLLKMNTQVRDIDVILSRLHPQKPQTRYLESLQRTLEGEKIKALTSARKKARRIAKLKTPRTSAGSISQKKLDRRITKVIARLDARICEGLPGVITNPSKVDELHAVRKECKKLRYTLELEPRKNTKAIQLLRSWQDILGAIHDSDIVLQRLTGAAQFGGREDLISEERSLRNSSYDRFVSSYKETFGAKTPASLLSWASISTSQSIILRRKGLKR